MNTTKNWIKIITLITLSVLLCVSAAGCFLKGMQPQRDYVALGDSISAGFGLPAEEGYVNLLFSSLEEEGLVNRVYNYSENGLTTAGLLKMLETMPEFMPEDAERLKKAEVITLSIGGNNILGPFIRYLPKTDELTDAIFQLVTFMSQSGETLYKAMEFVSETQDFIVEFSIFDVIQLLEFMEAAAPMLGDIADVLGRARELEILKLLPLLSGSFPGALDTDMQRGVDTFSAEFEEIVNLININAPDAVLIVNTLYNPFPEEGFMGMFTGLHSRADGPVKLINNIILGGAETGGYLVADVYSRFAAQPNVLDVINAGIDQENMTLSFDFIHPNKEGHEMIAKLHLEVLGLTASDE